MTATVSQKQPASKVFEKYFTQTLNFPRDYNMKMKPAFVKCTVAKVGFTKRAE